MKLLPFLCLLCLSSPVGAEENIEPMRSLFFTAKEESAIWSALAEKHRTNPTSAADLLHLGAILYSGPDQWTLWLQGETWTPTTDNDKIHVIEVTPNKVRLSLTLAPESKPQEVTLHPNQTYRLSTGQVLEGTGGNWGDFGPKVTIQGE